MFPSDEHWKTIIEFPEYKVSDQGRVLNTSNNRVLRESVTQSGVVKIGIVKGGTQFTRCVPLLVADTFVEGRDDIFNTPIHLDGDSRNNRADNLLWRPRAFAWKFTRQFTDIPAKYKKGPLVDIETGVQYKDVVEAAKVNGLLFEDVLKTITIQKPAFPTWQTFAFV